MIKKDTLNRIAHADHQAMRILFDYYYTDLYRYAYYFLGMDDMAKDVVQDVFLKLWKNRKNVPRIIAIESYLRTAIRNTSLDYLKKQRFSEFPEVLLQEIDQHANPLEQLSLQELEACLKAALQALPDRCQAIFTQVYLEDRKYKEVAEEMGISINTVKTQLRIALNRIRIALHNYKDF